MGRHKSATLVKSSAMDRQTSLFEKNRDKFIEFASWMLWYPDLFLDLLKPKEGGINLCADQRVFLRCATRFFSMYGCFPRGFGKTFKEVAALFVTAIRYPNIELSVTAQTRENAARLLKDKAAEMLRFYPLLKNEIVKMSFTRNDAEVIFKNGARIDALANSQSSKGLRRKRIMIEESVLMDNVTFEDALKPIVEVSRNTCGKLAIVNPEELNQQIHFFTTPGWRGSDEFVRSLAMVRDMVELNGEIVLGSDWMLPCWYGRGSSKSQILQKKKSMSSIAFDQNYGGRWTGSSSGALVNINKLMNCRSLAAPLFEAQKDVDEYYMGVDVARSQSSSNNQSAIVVGKVNRNQATNRIVSIDVVNVVGISNVLNFSSQAVLVKKLANRFHPKMVIVDGNGLGSGLVDELLKDTVDPTTREPLGCWDTINTDNEPESQNAEKCLYDLKAQGLQSRIVTVFIDMVESGKLRLLEKRGDGEFSDHDRENYKEFVVPFVQTDLLFEEISNLKIKELGGGRITVEKVISKLDKDRYSALSYMLWYISEFENKVKEPIDREVFLSMFAFKKPQTAKGRR